MAEAVTSLDTTKDGRARTMTADVERDERALVLRDEGRPFAGIAEILALTGAHAANAAFNRALRVRPKAEQDGLRSRETARLDALAARVRGREDLSIEEVVRRLRDLKHQRKLLFDS